MEDTIKLKDKKKSSSDKRTFRRDFKLNRGLYLFIVPAIILALIFNVLPMLGLVIAFKDYNIFLGDNAIDAIFKSPWVGLENFKNLFQSTDFFRVLGNTVSISVLKLIFAFPAPILLAILINEVRNNKAKRTIQSVSYLPHFISWVVLSGIFVELLGLYGVVNNLLVNIGILKDPVQFWADPQFYVPLIVITDIWKTIGWSSIIYLSTMTGINPSLYEAASIDGANKLQKILFITLPSLLPTIALLFILRLGYLLNAGFDQIFNTYSTPVYEVGDIIQTYVYRMGMGQGEFSFATAFGLFNSLVGFCLIILGNFISRKIFGRGMW